MSRTSGRVLEFPGAAGTGDRRAKKAPIPGAGDLAERGVFIAPWLGPNGEEVLLAVRRDRKLACPPRLVPVNGRNTLIVDALWELLDQADAEEPQGPWLVR